MEQKTSRIAQVEKIPFTNGGLPENAPTRPDKINKYGSWGEKPLFKATGYFYTEKYNNRWVLVDPEGYLHIESAVVGIRQGKGETNKTYFSKKFKDEQDWINTTIEQLASYGFNGAGTWSDDKAIQLYNQSRRPESFPIARCST